MVAWMAIFLAETKDRTLEELDELFENNLPARMFKGYVCVTTLSAMEHGAAEQIVGMEKENDIQVEDVVVNSKGVHAMIR
jgi:MFS transporter, SP family, sugar:H+ symporter